MLGDFAGLGLGPGFTPAQPRRTIAAARALGEVASRAVSDALREQTPAAAVIIHLMIGEKNI